jgi:ubiquinone/menaquinone biosynthesis C-methylase UbiE
MDEEKDIWAERLGDREYTTEIPDPFIADWIKKIAKKGERALDVGCGWGRHLVPLCKAGLEVIGLDKSPGMLAASKSYLDSVGLDVGLIQGDATEIPFPAECFQIVIATRTIHHGDRRFMVKCLKEIDRVLNIGGYLLASFPSINDWRFGEGIAIEPGTFVPELDQPEGGIPHHYSNSDELLVWLKNYDITGWEEKREFYEKQPTEKEIEDAIRAVESPLYDGLNTPEYDAGPHYWATYFVAAQKKSDDDSSFESTQ